MAHLVPYPVLNTDTKLNTRSSARRILTRKNSVIVSPLAAAAGTILFSISANTGIGVLTRLPTGVTLGVLVALPLRRLTFSFSFSTEETVTLRLQQICA